MPKLYPGINPSIGRGRRLVFFLTSVFFPFLLLAQPAITSITPSYGPVGIPVTITGTNFGATPADNIVYFGTAKATVTASSATTLTVTVPTGASYEPLTVTTGGLVAYSPKPFGVTFSDPAQFTTDAFATRKDVPVGTNPASVCAKDLDGDGKTDLVVLNGQQIAIYTYSGTPGFPDFTPIAPITPDNTDFPVTVAVGDLDGDGKPDLIVSMIYAPTIYVLRNTSTPGNISFDPIPIPLPASTSIGDMTINDINKDGKPEIIVANDQDNTIDVFLNKSTVGNLSFDIKQALTLTDQSYPSRVAAADLDGDGMPEVICSNSGTSTLTIFQNTGTRGGIIVLMAKPDIPTGIDAYGNGNAPTGLGIADIDGDGKLDIVTANQYGSSLSLFRNTSITGDISFFTEPASPPTVPYPGYMLINDLDGDGLPDIAVASQYGVDSVAVHRNTSTTGHIGFADYVDYHTGLSPWWLSAADFDGDGLPDIAVANNGASSVSVMINKKADGLTVSSFTPTIGTTGTVVTITGNYLTNVTNVTFGGTKASSFTVVSPTQITAVVGTGSSGPVTVIMPIAFAYKDGFTYNLLPQTITSFSPQTAGSGTAVTILGTGFVSNSIQKVSFGGTKAQSFTVISDMEISAVVDTGATGNVSVMSLTDTANSAGFTFGVPPPTGPPTVTSFSPMSGTANTDITINGTNLLNISSVTFGGTPALSYTFITDKQIHAVVAAGTTGDVAVTTNNGSASYPGFTFLTAPPPPAPPKLSSFTPRSASTGQKVTITGTNLSGVTGISFGSSLALSYKATSDSVIEAYVGTGASGQIKVASPVGADSLTGFVYIQDTIPTTPVNVFQLVQFSGSVSNNQAHLSWQARYDGNIAYYAIERGVDGNQYTVIGTVPVNSKAAVNHNYSFTDFSPKNGVNYYRIKMADTTTHYTYTGTISMQIDGKTPLLAIYPNPVKYGFFLVDLPAATTTESVFQLADLSGRIMKTQKVSAGTAQVRIDIPGLPRGTYQLHWTDGTRTAYQNILVL